MKKLVVLCAACGVGKSTITEALNKSGTLSDYACIDADEVGLNWWDYEGTEQEEKFSDDCLAAAVKMSEGKNLLLSTCMNPFDYYGKITVPEEVGATYFIGMTCSDEEVRRRLKARPAERMCGDDEFIAGQIEYNNWFRKNANKFQYYIDNTEMTVEETAAQTADFLRKLN